MVLSIPCIALKTAGRILNAQPEPFVLLLAGLYFGVYRIFQKNRVNLCNLVQGSFWQNG